MNIFDNIIFKISLFSTSYLLILMVVSPIIDHSFTSLDEDINKKSLAVNTPTKTNDNLYDSTPNLGDLESCSKADNKYVCDALSIDDLAKFKPHKSILDIHNVLREQVSESIQGKYL